MLRVEPSKHSIKLVSYMLCILYVIYFNLYTSVGRLNIRKVGDDEVGSNLKVNNIGTLHN